MKKLLIFCFVFFISQNVAAATPDFLKESTDTTCISVSGRSAQSERVVGDFKLVRTCIGTVWSDEYTIKEKVVSKTSFYKQYGEYLGTESSPISPKITSVSGEVIKTFDSHSALERHRKKILKLKQCGNGNDFYDGGEDTDTVIYTGNRDQFFITQHSDGSYTFKDLIQCGSDTDTVINFEKFEFTDRVLTLKNLNPDVVATTTEKVASITLTSPKSKRLSFTVGEAIPIGWKVKNAPQNSQVEYSIIKISEEKRGSSYEGLGGVRGQSGKLKKSSGKGLKNIITGGDSIASIGTYRIDAVVKACGTTCNFETFGMVNYPNITYAVAEPIVIQLVEKKAVSTKGSVAKSGLGLSFINISNPNTYKYVNGILKATDGDRIAVGLDSGDIYNCSLINPSKDLNVRGPFFSSETDSDIIEIDMAFTSPKKMYEIDMACGQKRDTIRIDFKNLSDGWR